MTRAIVLSLLAVFAVAVGPLVRSDPSGPASPHRVASVTVSGHGSGHGRGMGQYGAYGYARERRYRWDYARIVEHYYGGTHLERVSAAADRASLAVDLSELDAATTTTVRSLRRGARLTVNGRRQRRGTVTLGHGRMAQDVQATVGDVSVDLPGLGWHSYQGSIQIRAAGAPDGTGGQTWNIVSTEDYVAGVVPSESPAGWGATGGEAALQAQAVAARSYALAYVAAAGRICDTTDCQSYRGDPSTAGIGPASSYSDAATASTAGSVMCTVAAAPCPTADIVATEYSASTGGYTAGGTFPAVVDGGDAVAANPYHDWSTTVSLATVAELFPRIGPIRSLLVVARNGHGSYGGRALAVRITGTAGRRATVSGDQFAADVGLLSDWFRFATEP